tara:strand:+ start:5258 stop:5419 length:162 start_codon:yes stop_codon:yes gene_type:complete
MAKRKFPVLAVLILILGISWLLEEMAIMNLNLPWLPVIVIVAAIGMIWNRLKG